MERVAFLLLALVLAKVSAQSTDGIGTLFDWIRELGGEVNVEARVNEKGARGIYATKEIAQLEPIMTIPAAAVINVAAISESFAVPTLLLLRELKDPHSRFKPYIDTLPSPHEVVNFCNMNSKYFPMLKSAYWEKHFRSWNQQLVMLLEGKLDGDLEFTIREAVGNTPVTLQDLQYACALSSTRYVTAAVRRRLIMVPVFCLANHKRNCTTYMSSYETGDFLHVYAGDPLQPGDEVCYTYGSLRDDYAVASYGFLPDLENPPRLSLVDLHDFNPKVPYTHDGAPSEERFNGTREELHAEMNRLSDIHRQLQDTPDKVEPPPPGQQDPVYDMLKQLEQRRLHALEYEIQRIASLLGVKDEL